MTNLTLVEYIGFRTLNLKAGNESSDTWCGNCNATEYQAIMDAGIMFNRLNVMLEVMTNQHRGYRHSFYSNRNWLDAMTNYDRFADNYNCYALNRY